MKDFMSLANWCKSKTMKLLHWVMELYRNEPETTSAEWLEAKRRYKELVGREYDPNDLTWNENK